MEEVCSEFVYIYKYQRMISYEQYENLVTILMDNQKLGSMIDSGREFRNPWILYVLVDHILIYGLNA